MKRKGRRHLPKVGTKPDFDQMVNDRRNEALHPFSDPTTDRRGLSSTMWAILAVIIIVIAVIAFWWTT